MNYLVLLIFFMIVFLLKENINNSYYWHFIGISYILVNIYCVLLQIKDKLK